MGCNCGANRLGAAQKNAKKWVVTDKAGAKTTHSSEADARMKAARVGGTVKAA